MSYGTLNRIARRKSKLVCKLLVCEEQVGGRLLLRLVPSCVLLFGLLVRKTQARRTPQPIADGIGKQKVLYQGFMFVFQSFAYKLVHFYILVFYCRLCCSSNIATSKQLFGRVKIYCISVDSM